MNQLIRAGAITVAIFSSVGLAAAQNAPSQTAGAAHPDLTARQQQAVSQGLAASPSQPAQAGAQPQVGNKIPDSMRVQALPNDVTNQVPETKNLLFVKLPDRIMLIDPDTKLVTEIVMDSDSTTTGSNINGNSNSNSNQPSR
jgi:hypothetical protein